MRAEFAEPGPDVALWVPAVDASLPLARQTLRVLGVLSEGEETVLEDAEIAVTEAVSNAVDHAYPGGGTIELDLRFDAELLAISVRDHGRGLGTAPQNGRPEGSYGIDLIQALATDARFDALPGGGVEVAMTFAGGYTGAQGVTGGRRSEAVARRMTAVVAAQENLAVNVLPMLLRTVGMAALCAADYSADRPTTITVDRLDGSLEMTLHGLEPDGGESLLGVLRDDGLDESQVSAQLLPAADLAAGHSDLAIGLAAAI